LGRKLDSVEKGRPGILRRLGLIGMEAIEPIILAALITEAPLLLIGPHGVGKSWPLTRLAEALGLEFRHYNASLLNYDDLVGYPLPDQRGGLQYIQTPASIWGAQAVFIDEIARCRPDTQNKLFSIIHERRIQGVPLGNLRYRWSAMNPAPAADAEPAYAGCEPLDAALADRFAFVVTIPEWSQLSPDDQEAIILTTGSPPDAVSSGLLRGRIEAGRLLAVRLRSDNEAALTKYVRLVCALLAQADLSLSPRRAVMLLGNIVAVHAARLACDTNARFADSALMTLTHSLPQRATGETVSTTKIVAAHKEAWRATEIEETSALAAVLTEPDPLRRCLAAIQIRKLRKGEVSSVVADCLASLAPGARHALAFHLFESGAAGRLVASVAEQCAVYYGIIATPQNVHETIAAGNTRHRVWQHIVSKLSKLSVDDPGTPLVTNLICGLYATGELATENDVDRGFDHWSAARSVLTTAREKAA
jgi:MoxR-like ATPase